MICDYLRSKLPHALWQRGVAPPAARRNEDTDEEDDRFFLPPTDTLGV